MADPKNLAERNQDLLIQILEQLKDLNETIKDFTSDGLPLRAQVPTSELLASLMAAAALVIKERPALTANDLQGRVNAAQVLADQLIAAHDQYKTETSLQRLDQLAR
jgi:hypothetical protein